MGEVTVTPELEADGPPAAGVTRENGSGVEVVRFAGELDIATADELGVALTSAVESGAPVVVDLARCTFIDSTGIAAILRAVRLQSDGAVGKLALVGVHDQVDRVLKLTGVESAVEVYDGVSEAVTALGADGSPRSA
jgi:anti-anti-sigma factor